MDGCIILRQGQTLEAFRAEFQCPQCLHHKVPYTLTKSGMGFLHVRRQIACAAFCFLWQETTTLRDYVFNATRMALGQDAANVSVPMSLTVRCTLTVLTSFMLTT